mgnify:CR=1 FL=1
MEKGTNCYEPEENLRKSEDGNVEDKDSNMFSGS